jgi:hypothetical protein
MSGGNRCVRRNLRVQVCVCARVYLFVVSSRTYVCCCVPMSVVMCKCMHAFQLYAYFVVNSIYLLPIV